jgi:hypothetical protein
MKFKVGYVSIVWDERYAFRIDFEEYPRRRVFLSIARLVNVGTRLTALVTTAARILLWNAIAQENPFENPASASNSLKFSIDRSEYTPRKSYRNIS